MLNQDAAIDLVVVHDENALVFQHLESPANHFLRTTAAQQRDGQLVQIQQVLSVLFTDLAGFTGLSERLGSAVVPILTDYLSRASSAIHAEGGTIDKFIGDAVMAIFGAPVHRDDHREQSVRAALEMIELLKAFNEQRTVQKKRQIEIGIGIASGQVVAGYTGTHHRATYTCVGDTVNVAARLESHTKVVSRPILIDEHTRCGLDDVIAVEAQGELQVKGKTQPVKVYAVRVDSLVAESV